MDLRLDELADALGPGETGRHRLGILLSPLPDADAVRFRQGVFRDLDEPIVGEAMRELVGTLERVRATLARTDRMRHAAERDRWVLEAMAAHDDAVVALCRVLEAGPVASAGLAAVRAHLRARTSEAAFVQRRAALAATRATLDAVAYRLRIGQQRVVVGPVREEPDLAAEIDAAFARFRDGASTPVRVDAFDTLDMNPIEAAVLGQVARLVPEPFAALAATVAAHQPVIDPDVAAIAEDAAWYLAVLDMLAPLRAAGLGVSHPAISEDGRLEAIGVFDLALARRLVAEDRVVATSDVSLTPGERLVVVTGPSQSGRTTLARALGQLHVLAAAGCPVPASAAILPLADAVHTVFDRPERLDDPGGRLRSELHRLGDQLAASTASTVVVANDPFASTTADDALELGRRLQAAVLARGARMVAVTFLEELAAGAETVSLSAVLDAADPESRTFRFERRPPDGLAFAQALASAHGLDAASIRTRMAR